MKVKCDFVTNSSSCSFVMIGIKTTRKELVKKYGEDFYESVPSGLTAFSEPTIIGKLIASGESDEFGISSTMLDFSKLDRYFNEVSEILGVEKSKVKLMTGERSC